MTAVSWRRQNIKEGTITWHGISIGNFVVNVDWKELIADMNRSRRDWWKVKTSRYCGISQSSVIGKSRQEGQTLSFLIRRIEIVIIDVAIPGDDRVKVKELEKVEKYQQEKKTNSGCKHFHFILDVLYAATYIIRSDG